MKCTSVYAADVLCRQHFRTKILAGKELETSPYETPQRQITWRQAFKPNNSSLCSGQICMVLFRLLVFCSKAAFSKYSQNVKQFGSSSGRRFVGPDLGTSYLQRISADTTQVELNIRADAIFKFCCF